MNQIGVLFAMGFFIATPILLVLALVVRFAGESKPLNCVDYSRSNDVVRLNRHAGNRLLVLPLLWCAAGTMALQAPRYAIVWLLMVVVATVCIALWICASAGAISPRS